MKLQKVSAFAVGLSTSTFPPVPELAACASVPFLLHFLQQTCAMPTAGPVGVKDQKRHQSDLRALVAPSLRLDWCTVGHSLVQI